MWGKMSTVSCKFAGPDFLYNYTGQSWIENDVYLEFACMLTFSLLTMNHLKDMVYCK